MTRSERRNLVAILTAIVLIIAGIIAAVFLGVKGPEAADAAADADTAVTETTEAPTPVDPLAGAKLNQVASGKAPAVADGFGSGDETFEHMRSWEGEIEVWRGYLPQIILGPGETWFPAGQPGCGEGRYIVEFQGSTTVEASLRDEVGETADDKQLRHGWMLIDDCHLPFIALPTGADSPSDTVSFHVHEFQPAG
ncbi:hypothetical protein [Corynebacterium sp.]|uniref:hypothetical protein n=1 Tax=Corynebacterium sp. TaxID=1720 RepID=UPI0026DF0414|nr:hypothetical protein [Corynebacterium sp.]MDO5511820.1 hypothetical protein [Corynebacterium sp.]